MAAEESEKLARRLQAEEDSIAELLLHDLTDEATLRRLQAEFELENKPKQDATSANVDNITVPNLTHNNDLQYDEALARLLQAEEEERAQNSVPTEEPHSHSSSSKSTPVTTQLDSDAALARLLQAQQEQDTNSRTSDNDISDELELFSATPDIHALFRTFDNQYFGGQLRMVEHEMIHALLFVTQRNTDHDGHGPQFLMHAARINKLAGTNITVYHNFRDEVKYHRTHVWKCDGPCSKRPPFYGIVRRAMNRPPQKADYWWDRHQKECGGTYTKIAEPEKKTPPSKKQREPEPQGNQLCIETFFKRPGNDDRNSSSSASDKVVAAAKRRCLAGPK
ncbi:hypothetical protein Unana1_08477 [Umbelopsis nana]